MLSKEEALLKNKLYYLFISLILLGGFLYSQDPPEEFEFNQGYNQSFYFFINMDIAGESLDENDWIGAFKTYDETQGGECIQSEMNFDETMGGMCSAIGQCYAGFEGCNPEDCSEDLDVNNDGLLSSCACPDLNDDDLLASQSLNLCIGSRRYGDCLDLNARNCDIPVIGYDGNCYSGGYIEPGEYPYFKVYDHSENETYYTEISDNHPWNPNQFHVIDSLSVIYDCNGELGGYASLDT